MAPNSSKKVTQCRESPVQARYVHSHLKTTKNQEEKMRLGICIFQWRFLLTGAV